MSRIIRFLVTLSLSVLKRTWPNENTAQMAVDGVVIIRFLKNNSEKLSGSARYQLLEVAEDRLGNLATSFKGWDDFFREREQAMSETLNEYLD